MVRELVVESRGPAFGPGTKPDVPHMPVNPDILETEAGGLLKLAGF